MAYFYVNVFLFSKEVLWIIPNRLMCWPLVPGNQRLDYSCARLEKLKFYRLVKMWAAKFRDAWTWPSKEIEKLAQDFSGTFYTSSEIQSTADHCLWRVFTEEADPLLPENKISQSFFRFSESKNSYKFSYMCSVQQYFWKDTSSNCKSSLLIMPTPSWCCFNKVGYHVETHCPHEYSSIHTSVNKDFYLVNFWKRN